MCSAGLLRSPTVAWILSNDPFNFNTRAAGSTKTFALIHADDVLIHWSDAVVFVNKENFEETSSEFDLADKHVITLNLPDNFGFKDPKLVQIASVQLSRAFNEMEDQLK